MQGVRVSVGEVGYASGLGVGCGDFERVYSEIDAAAGGTVRKA